MGLLVTEVLIGGIPYIPAGQTTPKVGVAITTHNRPDVLATTLQHWRDHTPADIPIIVVDDGSATPVTAEGVTVVRHESPRGIAGAKNRSLAELMTLGVEHLFLVDDDFWPTTDNWWQPYVEAPYLSMCYLFEDIDARGNHITGKPATLYEDGQVRALAKPRGCLLYVQRHVVDTIGGFRLDFGRWGGEHEEFQNRAWSAGLVPFPFMDVCGAENIWYSMDENFTKHQGFTRSVPQAERTALVERNEALRESYCGSTDFVEYRERNVVLTCLLTSLVDPQRGQKWVPDPTVLDTLLKSLRGCEPVVITDEVDLGAKVPVSEQVYIQRWISYGTWLRQHPDIRWVWCVDGTDVEMLREPWTFMEPDTLYMGWEPCLIRDNQWMLDPKRHNASHKWLTEHPDQLLLNMGVVGGDRATVLRFIQRVINLWAADKLAGVRDEAGDMGLGQRAAEGMRVVTGPRVTTTFKANQDNNTAAWRHK